MELGDVWNWLRAGDIPKNIDYAEFMRVRITINSDWRRMSVEIMENKMQTQIFTWSGLFWNQM